MEVDDLHRLMNITNSAIHDKTPVIPTTNPTFSPAMRDVGDGELEGETDTLVLGSFPACGNLSQNITLLEGGLVMCQPQSLIATLPTMHSYGIST